MILQYYFPATEYRAFVEDKNPDDYGPIYFDIEKVIDDPAYAKRALDILNTKLIQEFYPFRLRTNVHPGFIFQWTSGIYFDKNHWKVQLINDFWAKSHETFGDICIPKGTPPLKIDCGMRPEAFQSRIGGSVSYTIARPLKRWTFSLYGDTASWSEGIGKDFTIALNIECNF
jgi:hypothetical protein